MRITTAICRYSTESAQWLNLTNQNRNYSLRNITDSEYPPSPLAPDRFALYEALRAERFGLEVLTPITN
jgi:hypothetical protein